MIIQGLDKDKIINIIQTIIDYDEETPGLNKDQIIKTVIDENENKLFEEDEDDYAWEDNMRKIIETEKEKEKTTGGRKRRKSKKGGKRRNKKSRRYSRK